MERLLKCIQGPLWSGQGLRQKEPKPTMKKSPHQTTGPRGKSPCTEFSSKLIHFAFRFPLCFWAYFFATWKNPCFAVDRGHKTSTITTSIVCCSWSSPSSSMRKAFWANQVTTSLNIKLYFLEPRLAPHLLLGPQRKPCQEMNGTERRRKTHLMLVSVTNNPKKLHWCFRY